MKKNPKSFLSKALAVALTVLMLVAASVLVVSAAETSNVAKIGDTEYATLQAAINAAQAGDTVTLLKDITLGSYVQGKTDAAVVINKAITLDGNGKTLTSKAGRAINVDVAGGVEIKNLTIKQYCGRNSNDQKRCINVINQTATLKVTGCTLEMVEHNSSGRTLTSYVAGVQAATGSNHNIVIDNCDIKTIYGVVVYAAGSEINVTNSAISNALYGAWINAECELNIENSKVTTKEDMGTNNLGVAFLVQAAGVSVAADEKTVINVPAPKGSDGTATGGQAYALYSSKNMADLGKIDLNAATINKTATTDPVVYLAGAQAQINRPDGTVMYDTLDEAIAGLTEKDHLDVLESLDDTVIDRDDVNAKLEELDRDFSYNEGGAAVPNAVVQIVGGDTYGTLADAIEAAQADQTITFLANITENVTIDKAITIDGNGKTYTGVMTIDAENVTIAIQNVNFIEGNLTSAKDTSKGTTLKIIDCHFYSERTINHAIEIRDIEQLIIEGGSVTNYKLSAVYVPSAHSKNVVINGTTFDKMGSYTIRIASGMGAELNGVTIKNVYGGLLADTAKEYIFTDCTFENVTLPITSWSGTLTGTFMFKGANKIPNLSTNSGGTFLLAAGATLTAPAGLTNIDTNVEGYEVVDNNGVYTVVEAGLKGSGTETDPYQIGSVKDLILFRDGVNAGETEYNAAGMYFVLTADIDLTGINWVGIGSATAEHGFMGNFDGNGYKIKNLTITNPAVDADGYAYAGFFSVTEGAAGAENVIKNLIIENVTISTTGDIVAAAIAYPYYTTVENVTVCGDIHITGGNYTAGALAYTRRCVNASNVTVSGNAGSTITGKVTVGGVISDIQMNGGLTANYSNFSVSNVTIKGDKSVGGIAGIICKQTLNGATVKNVTLVCDNAAVGTVAGSWGDVSTIKNVKVENVTGATAVIGATYKDGKAVEAKIGDTYYATFEQAINVAFATAYANNGAKQTVYTAAGEKYAELGTWGGIDWTLTADGTLTIAPTKGTPVADKNAPTKRTYEVGEWRERVVYNKNGGASSVGGAPYAMNAVKKLIIEEGVTYIGSFTAQFPNLVGEVVIPSTVTYIGQEAFYAGSTNTTQNINKLTFAAGGTAPLCIANGAFKSVEITEVSFPGDREYIHIHHWAFGGSPNLTTAYIPANVTKCWGGEHVDYFDNFNSQTNVSWTYISSPFTGCTAMQTVTFENEAVRDLFFGSNRNSTAEDPMVAYAGLVAYNTFDEALAAALEQGVTLGLAKNVTLKDTLVIPAGKTLVFNLNGKTLSQSKACTESYSMIENKGNLTITGNGKISFTDTGAGDPNFGWGSYTIRNEGTLVVENGTIEFKGNQAFGTHCSLAIFQYAGSTTINGGKIINNAYRSVRLWSGDITINGGTFEGQVWVHCVDDSAKLTINGGTFAPATSGDASSVFVNNSGKKAELAITGGTFATKIGANDADALAGAITGGLFTEAAKNGTNATLVAGVFEEEADENGYYGIIEAVASVNGVKYATLADAIADAQAGQTITFLANITENVTISKNINIDGADFTFTGKITINNNVEVTIENVNFVKGYIIYDNGNAAYGKLVVKNCSFVNGGYAIETVKVQSVTIEGCTVSGQSLLYARLSTQNILVKDTTVSGGNYGAHIVTGSKATFDNVKMADMYCGILVQNVGAKTITIRNCEFSNAEVAEWDTKGTATDTYILEGTNIIPLLPDSNYAIIKLAKDAIVYANKVVYATVTTDVIGYTAIYNENDGAYVLDVLKVDIVMTNIRMGETISHLFAVPFNKNIGEGHVAILTMGENEFEIPYSTTDWKVLTDENGTKYFVIEFTGIAAKQMVDEVSIYITFGTDTVSNKTVTTSVRDYAMALLEDSNSSDELKTMLVDMLNYGAAAQVYFGYNTADLANTSLDEEQMALASTTTVKADYNYTTIRKITDGFADNFVATSVRFNNCISLVFQVQFADVDESWTATFTYGDQSVSAQFVPVEGKENVYALELNTLVVAEAYELVTCTISVGSNSIQIQDSVAAYIARMTQAGSSASENGQALYNAFIKFANSADAYLD